MSFISILGKVGQVALGIEHVAGPIAATFIPGAAPVVAVLDKLSQGLQGSIVQREILNPADGQGQSKAALVTSDFQAGLAFTQDLLAGSKLKAVYDAALLQQAIDSQVKAFNDQAALKTSIKIVPL